MPARTPIRRHPAIVQFSREHHTGLLLVWKIREGLRRAVAPDRIGRYVAHAFDTDLEPHFQAEETLLFSRLDDGQPLKMQALEEHRRLRAIVRDIREQADKAGLLSEFAQALENHIRFEERALFNFLQEHLPAEDLAAIATAHPAAAAACEVWADRFWENI